MKLLSVWGWLSVVMIGAFAAPPDLAKRNAMCIQPSAENPFYWEYDGKLTILLGGFSRG